MSEVQAQNLMELEATKLNDQLKSAKIALGAPKFEGSTKGRPKSFWSVWKGNPSFNVFTNHPNDEGKKPIRIGLDKVNFNLFVDHALNICDTGKPGDEVRMECYTGKPQDKQKVGELVVGRGSDGTVYYGAVVPGHTNVQFRITSNGYHVVLNGDGTPMDRLKQAGVIGRSHFEKVVGPMVNRLIDITYEAPPKQEGGYQKKPYGDKKPWQNNQGGGGYQRNNSGGSGYQNNNSGGNNYNQGSGGDPYDDDIPM
jgi:hypothetical protein